VRQPFTAAVGNAVGAVDFPGLAQQALQLQAYRAQQATQQRVSDVVAATKGISDPYQRIAKMVTELAGEPGTEDLVGKLSNVLAQLKPPKRARLIPKIVKDAQGVPRIGFYDADTGEHVTTSQETAYIPPVAGALPSEGERRAGALLTTADAAYKLLQNAQAPNLQDYLAGKIPMGLGQGLVSARQQLQNQAGAQFYRSYLYIVSGATVNPNEAEEAAKTFVPQWGDDPALVQQKLEQQKVMIEAMRQAAGRAGPKPGPSPPPEDDNLDDFLP
jgi:hypothetical protein